MSFNLHVRQCMIGMTNKLYASPISILIKGLNNIVNLTLDIPTLHTAVDIAFYFYLVFYYILCNLKLCVYNSLNNV